jgi:hypothetical protein
MVRVSTLTDGGYSRSWSEFAMKARAKHLIIIVVAVLAVYVGSYAVFRSNHVEMWEEDNHSYLIFPEDRVYLY